MRKPLNDRLGAGEQNAAATGDRDDQPLSLPELLGLEGGASF
jgi:hypothetical protein